MRASHLRRRTQVRLGHCPAPCLRHTLARHSNSNSSQEQRPLVWSSDMMVVQLCCPTQAVRPSSAVSGRSVEEGAHVKRKRDKVRWMAGWVAGEGGFAFPTFSCRKGFHCLTLQTLHLLIPRGRRYDLLIMMMVVVMVACPL